MAVDAGENLVQNVMDRVFGCCRIIRFHHNLKPDSNREVPVPKSNTEFF